MKGEGFILRGERLGEVKDASLILLKNWFEGVDGCELLFFIIRNLD